LQRYSWGSLTSILLGTETSDVTKTGAARLEMRHVPSRQRGNIDV
jgi:hypothetical protein